MKDSLLKIINYQQMSQEPTPTGNLQLIEQFASTAHGMQRRKFADEPYINHPLRVMQICKRFTDDVTVLAAALLHDVLEDTSTSQQEMLSFLETVLSPFESKATLEMVIDLTDIYTSKNYPQWNRRIRKNHEVNRLSRIRPTSQTIKYADIIDNSKDILRAEEDFARKYLHECRQILKNLKKGNRSLWEEAIGSVNDALDKSGKR
jgi:(p)ppGpp synthase/HD superfamily hydrolase